MSSNDAHGHDEPHLPHGSIWPFWLAMGITLAGLGLILNVSMLAVGLLALVVTLFGWLREDYMWWKTNTGTGEQYPVSGTKLFIGSELFIFGALFSTYFTFRAIAGDTGTGWPDDPHVHLPVLKTAIFTIFLFASSATIHKAEGYLAKGNKKGFNNWWLLTIILGAVFLAGQVWEYTTLIGEGHGFGSSQFMSTFYMLTGTHGLHVFGGLVYLIIVYIRSVKGQFNEKRHAAPKTAAMYWHFVDIVWVFVFGTLYLWQ